MAFYNSPFNATIVNKRIEGEGTFTFENKSIYQGSFKDGQFHGKGTIYFANGGKLEADWKMGLASDEKFTFVDGLTYQNENWDYCTKQDRRFYEERVHGFSQGIPQLSNGGASGVIPIQSDQHGYCYYDEKNGGNLFSFDGDLIGLPNEEELKWIKTRQFKSRG